MGDIKLSVIIPTFNRRDVLERTAPELLAQDFPPEDLELIYVVNGSTDGSAEMLRGLKPKSALRILEQPNRGPSAARNNGLKEARGGLVLFLDDDLLCPPNLLTQHFCAHSSLAPVVVHGPVYIAEESPQTIVRYISASVYEECYLHRDPAAGLPFPMNASSLVNSSMPRAMLLECGGFDEHTRSAEDLELGLRLWRKGTEFRFLPAAQVSEFFVKSSPEYVQRQMKRSALGEIYVCRKHPEYRRHSWFARLGLTKGWKGILRNLLARSPLSPVPLLASPLWIADRLSRFMTVRKTGIRLLEFAATITMLRAGAKAAGSWKALQSEFGRRLPVLMYHHVGPQKPGTYPSLTVSPQRFERQVRWLALRGYTGIRSTDWLRWLRDGKGLPEKPVLLTFDDAYAEVAEYALPVLRRHGFSAVVFVVTELVGKTNAWDERQGSGTHLLMTADQIRYWAAQGIEFGAHSRTHADLATLNADELVSEVVGSRDQLGTILGLPVTSFAYPFGSYNQAVQDCARKAFDMIFLADEQTPGLNFLTTDPHHLQRTMVQPGDTLADLECRIRRGHSPIMEFRERHRLRSRFERAASSFLGRPGP